MTTKCAAGVSAVIPPMFVAPSCMRYNPRPSWGGSSVGRASRSQCEGRGFDPLPLHHKPGPRPALQRGIALQRTIPPVMQTSEAPAPGRILIVDDQPLTRELMTLVVQAQGHKTL